VIPGPVLGLVEQTPSITLPGVPTTEHECKGAKFHSPRPMLLHAFEVEGGEPVYLCGTCADNVQLLTALLEEHQGDIPWNVKRCFGNLVRSVASATLSIAE
jgi:hypothetical protein